jgi:hypothetical protein
MGTLNEARAELAEAVAGALDAATVTTYDHVPERLVIPAAMISLGSPYLTDGETFGELAVRYVVDLVPDMGDNAEQTGNLIDMIEAEIVAMIAAGYMVEQVAQPRMLSVNNANYLAASVTVTDRIQL